MGLIKELIGTIRDNQFDEYKNILKEPINLNLPTPENEYVIFQSLKNSKLDYLDLLILNQVDINTVNENGESPLIVALKEKKINAAKILILNDADLDIQDKNGETALFAAAKSNREDIFETLINLGADPAISNNEGVSVKQYLEENQLDEMLQLVSGGDKNENDIFQNVFNSFSSIHVDESQIVGGDLEEDKSTARIQGTTDTMNEGLTLVHGSESDGIINDNILVRGNNDENLNQDNEKRKGTEKTLGALSEGLKPDFFNNAFSTFSEVSSDFIEEIDDDDENKEQENKLETSTSKESNTINYKDFKDSNNQNESIDQTEDSDRINKLQNSEINTDAGKSFFSSILEQVEDTTENNQQDENDSTSSTNAPPNASLVEAAIENATNGESTEDTILAKQKMLANKTNAKGQTLLMIAAGKGEISQVNQLLKIGASINKRDHSGKTALMYAVANNQSAVLHILLSRNAKLDIKDEKLNTALIIAVRRQNIDCIQTLLEAGANADDKVKGKTILMTSAEYGNANLCELLLKYGANPRLNDYKGLKASDYAKRQGHPALAEQLLRVRNVSR